MPQLWLQQTSPFLQTLGPQGTVLAGHWITQWCGHTCPGGQFAQTVRQPTLRAVRDIRVPAISGELDPHAATCAAHTTSSATNNVRAFTMLPSARFCRFLTTPGHLTQQVLFGNAKSEAARVAPLLGAGRGETAGHALDAVNEG